MDPAELTNLVKLMARTIDELREEIASLRKAISSDCPARATSSGRPTAAKAMARRRRQPTAPGLTKAEEEELLRLIQEDRDRKRREQEELNKLIAEAARNAPVLEEYRWR